MQVCAANAAVSCSYLGAVRKAVHHRLSPEVVIQVEQANGQLMRGQEVQPAQCRHVILAPA